MDLENIKGLSDKRIAELNKIGIDSAEKLIMHFPRNYLDLTHIVPVKYAIACEYCFTKAKLVSAPKVFTSSRSLRCVKALCAQNEEVFEAIWFNQPYVASKLKPETDYFFYGRIQKKFGQTSMVNPTFEPVDKNDRLKGILPVYTVTPSIYQKTMQSIILFALNKLRVKSNIPDALIKKYELASLEKAYYAVHSPQNLEQKDLASDRIAIEEYFMLTSAFKLIKGDKMQVRVNRYSASATDLKLFSKRFGFVEFDFFSGENRREIVK